MIRQLRFLPLPALAGALFLFAPAMTLAATITVTMTDNALSPQNVLINPGDTIVWVNAGAVAHTATADNGTFDTGSVNPNASATATFNAAGTYTYHCRFHPSMTGTIVVGSGGTVPVTGGNPAQISAQAQALLAQITALQAQLRAAGGGGAANVSYSSCPVFSRSLKIGLSGTDVTQLQQFLAQDPSVYPEGKVTGYFGPLTQTAVQRWQKKYGIASPGVSGYGIVGPRTSAAIAAACAGGGITPIPDVGGYISVTPISGNSPLQVSVTATINTTKSCQAATYTLDFGDGSPQQQIPVAAGYCAEQTQVFPHIFQYGGTYKIKLTAGGHEVNATVTVSGQPPPVFTPGLPAESFQVQPTSGAAPLIVTFAGIVNSNDKGFCAGGCASILDFGDGTSAQVALPASVGGWLNYNVQHTYTQGGGYRATLYQGGAGPSQPTVGSQTIVVAPPTATSTNSGGGGDGSYTYSPPVVSVAGGDLSFAVQFDLPTACTGYDLSWGDGTTHEIQNDGGSSCAQNGVVHTSTHQYTNSGNYTITLKRGASFSRTDDVSLNIAN